MYCDLRENAVPCEEKRIARLMRQAKLRSVRGYKRPRHRVGMPATTAVIDLYSWAVADWSINSTMATEVVLDAMMMAIWRRRPKTPVIIHSGQGSQFGSDDFNRCCKDNQLVPGMSRRGNCWNNAVAESFSSRLKKEPIKCRIYASGREAKSDVFDYIDGFYNRVRRYSHLDQLSPLAFEQLQTRS